MLSDDLLRSVVGLIPAVWELGSVAAVSGNTATVTVGAETLLNVHWVISGTSTTATPTVGQNVVLLAAKNQRIILGAVS